MNTKKYIKKAKRLQFAMKILTKLQTVTSKRVGKERFVDISHGKIRVLEYGFDTQDTSPLYVDMHGGGFILGSADMDEAMNRYFAEKAGLKIISIDYPKAPDYPYPIAVEAVYEVIKHYIDNSAAYKINPDCIGIGGHSAGANLATVTCIRAKEKGDFIFKFQILDYPPLDLYKDPYEKPTPKEAISPKMAAMFNACYVTGETAKLPYASPVYASREQLSGLPPAMLIVAGLDSLHDEGVRYGEMLKEAGVTVELHDFKESAHGFTYNKTPDAKEANKLMADFISSHI